ncbi:MAG: histidine phosphatase family protein [Acaryochloris sp. RU_4_1]|nr:histidine phosphatase family protein [Acaryochloris sp. RU_4_1]NJR53198.1 histidine phosphatase family protein [Acaryochloris sp. CRU_2_0]
MATRVILVRHGESTFNVEGRVQGHLDESTLTEQGLADAQRVGDVLKEIAFDAIYCSPLQRAGQTAKIITQGLATGAYPVPQPQVVADLIEIGLPLWEGMLFEQVKTDFPQEYQCWKTSPEQLCMELPGSDGSQGFFPVPALYEQAQRLWEYLLPRHPHQTLLLVGHSGINRALLSTALGLTPDSYQRFQQANCNISVLNFPDDLQQKPQLEALNLTDHLGLPLPKWWRHYRALRLILVRHGETEWNRRGQFQGQIDVPLNDNGRQQGQQAADFLKDIPIDFAVSSSLARPKETAGLILNYHPQVQLELSQPLWEISHGTWEGCLEPEIEARYPGELERWRTMPEKVQMPEGENLQQVWDRAIAAWDEIVATALAKEPHEQTGLVVAHDAINKVVLCHVAGLGSEHFWCFKQGNGAVSVIDFDAEGQPILQAMNITTHLEGGILDRTAAGAL